MRWLNVKRDQLFCPSCLSGKKIFFKRVEPPIFGYKSASSNLYFIYKCNNCNWRGDSLDLLNETVIKNIKRTNLIDKILE